MVVDCLVLVQRKEWDILLFHLALGLAGAWSCLERMILKKCLALISDFVVLIDEDNA